MANRNRLFFDIETSPCLGWFWRPSHKTSIGYHQILEQAKIICICYKWEHSDKIYSLKWDSKQNDKAMISKFIKVMAKADEISGHNCDRFDTKWIRTRAIYHRLPMPPEYTSIDTLKESRKGFNFPSNRLDAICKYLGIGEKIKTTEQLWMDIWRNKSSKAMAEMIKYCKMDVLILQEYFTIINPYIKHKTHYGCRGECPECGSGNIIISNRRKSATGIVKVQLKCKDCGKHHSMGEKQFNKLQDVKLA
ncbi:MAG: ribonuclease H-like domain-containing protein [Nostocales cyanobacterium LE14-WE12]|nr:ribonuclease H-like domain-containing protein [Nostocales cyanobacterium LE14-WE12]